MDYDSGEMSSADWDKRILELDALREQLFGPVRRTKYAQEARNALDVGAEWRPAMPPEMDFNQAIYLLPQTLASLAKQLEEVKQMEERYRQAHLRLARRAREKRRYRELIKTILQLSANHFFQYADDGTITDPIVQHKWKQIMPLEGNKYRTMVKIVCSNYNLPMKVLSEIFVDLNRAESTVYGTANRNVLGEFPEQICEVTENAVTSALHQEGDDCLLSVGSSLVLNIDKNFSIGLYRPPRIFYLAFLVLNLVFYFRRCREYHLMMIRRLSTLKKIQRRLKVTQRISSLRTTCLASIIMVSQIRPNSIRFDFALHTALQRVRLSNNLRYDRMIDTYRIILRKRLPKEIVSMILYHVSYKAVGENWRYEYRMSKWLIKYCWNGESYDW